MKDEKIYALFDEKDIMFDAFIDDLADDSCATYSTGYDVTCFIAGYPVYIRSYYSAQQCHIKCFTDDIDFVLKALTNQFSYWNENSEREKDCGVQFIWECEKTDESTIIVRAKKIVTIE